MVSASRGHRFLTPGNMVVEGRICNMDATKKSLKLLVGLMLHQTHMKSPISPIRIFFILTVSFFLETLAMEGKLS